MGDTLVWLWFSGSRDDTTNHKPPKEKVEGDTLAGQWHRMLLFAVAHGPRPNIPTRASPPFDSCHHQPARTWASKTIEPSAQSCEVRVHRSVQVGLSLGRYIGEANSSFAPETNMPFHRKASGGDTKRPGQSKQVPFWKGVQWWII
jgi:hypothetical protein